VVVIKTLLFVIAALLCATAAHATVGDDVAWQRIFVGEWCLTNDKHDSMGNKYTPKPEKESCEEPLNIDNTVVSFHEPPSCRAIDVKNGSKVFKYDSGNKEIEVPWLKLKLKCDIDVGKGRVEVLEAYMQKYKGSVWVKWRKIR
jgi:hypothetical protein